MSSHSLADRYVQRVRCRLNMFNKNWLAIVCGETGSGKSYSALSIAHGIGGKVFVVFNGLEFMDLLNSGKVGKGDTVIFDEAGVGLSARDWYSVQNKIMGAVLQTFRNMNIAVIFTTPNLTFIDVQARKLFHSYFETSFIDRKEQEAYLKVYDIQINSRLDKIYYKFPKFETEKGVVDMQRIILDKPNETICKWYEEKKTAYTKKLNADALAELRGDNKKPVREKFDVEKAVETVLNNKAEFFKTKLNKKSYLDASSICNKLGVGTEIARRIKSLALEKLEV